MALLRLSVLKNTLYAPEANGSLCMGAYDTHCHAGRMETLAPPLLADKHSRLWHYLTQQIGVLGKMEEEQPLVILVHGFLFDPKQAVSNDPKETDNPHGRLYHFVEADAREEERHHTTGWPLRLGFDPADVSGRTGLAVAFGWHSQPGFASSLLQHFQNFYARAYDYAGQTAWALVNVMHALSGLMPGRRIDLFCHSLGARVVIRAIAQLCEHRPALASRLGRVLLLGGAEYAVEAQLMMRRLLDLGGALPSFYNFVSRENDVLDLLGEHFGPRGFGNHNVIGHNGLGNGRRAEQWIDLRIDCPRLAEWLRPRGFSISGDDPASVWDHWHYYTHRPNMALYRSILRERERWEVGALRAAGVPEGLRFSQPNGD